MIHSYNDDLRIINNELLFSTINEYSFIEIELLNKTLEINIELFDISF